MAASRIERAGRIIGVDWDTRIGDVDRKFYVYASTPFGRIRLADRLTVVEADTLRLSLASTLERFANTEIRKERG